MSKDIRLNSLISKKKQAETQHKTLVDLVEKSATDSVTFILRTSWFWEQKIRITSKSTIPITNTMNYFCLGPLRISWPSEHKEINPHFLNDQELISKIFNYLMAEV